MITRTAVVYVVTMALGALVLAGVAQLWPTLREGSFTPLILLLLISLLYDMMALRHGERFQVGTLTMPERMVGFVGGAFLYIMLNAAFSGQPLT